VDNGAACGGYMKPTHTTTIVALLIILFASRTPATTATVNYNETESGGHLYLDWRMDAARCAWTGGRHGREERNVRHEPGRE
jgi:hypothetical protein